MPRACRSRTASVDAITIAFGIRNVEQPAAACDEMRRVLRPAAGSRFWSSAAASRASAPAVPLVLQSRPAAHRAAGFAPRAAYGYLPASVGAFASPREFVTILRQHGFSDVQPSR